MWWSHDKLGQSVVTSQRPNKELPTQVQKDWKEEREGKKGEGGREEGREGVR